MASHRKWLEELNLPLSINNALVIEFWNTGNGCCTGATIEIDHFLVFVLEGQDDWVGGEGSKVGVQFVEEMELVGCAAYAVSEEENITLEPGDPGLDIISSLV
jgi:hypothetical protein